MTHNEEDSDLHDEMKQSDLTTQILSTRHKDLLESSRGANERLTK
jgi:hypothetical protein